ncbi:6776_t:CDS:2 [Funneliformis mosseae]|uniref:6776_t:CDS:1 n=1 Tax=Funneliformis mosseae TaxID=27381 RepID=A0A9N9BAZ2_FUNMO|nr:6776_t:CDS:2 [Funneliformis mosseae]
MILNNVEVDSRMSLSNSVVESYGGCKHHYLAPTPPNGLRLETIMLSTPMAEICGVCRIKFLCQLLMAVVRRNKIWFEAHAKLSETDTEYFGSNFLFNIQDDEAETPLKTII